MSVLMSQPSQTPPPHAVLLQMIFGEWVSRAVSAVAKYGIADHLENGPKSAKELAALSGTKEQPLYRLLRTTASLGVFTELEDGRFAQTPLSEPLRSNARPCVRNLAMMLTDDWHMRGLGAIAVVYRNRQVGFVQIERHGNVRLDGAESRQDRELQ